MPNVLQAPSRSRSSDPTSATGGNPQRAASAPFDFPGDLVDESARRPDATTSAPASASPSASARPIPLVPPTTTAARSDRSSNDMRIRFMSRLLLRPDRVRDEMNSRFCLDGRTALGDGRLARPRRRDGACPRRRGRRYRPARNEQPGDATPPRRFERRAAYGACLTADLARPSEADALVASALDAMGRHRHSRQQRRHHPPRRRPPAYRTRIGTRSWRSTSNSVPALSGAGRHLIDTGGAGKIINVASLLSFQGGITVPATPRPRAASCS